MPSRIIRKIHIQERVSKFDRMAELRSIVLQLDSRGQGAMLMKR